MDVLIPLICGQLKITLLLEKLYSNGKDNTETSKLTQSHIVFLVMKMIFLIWLCLWLSQIKRDPYHCTTLFCIYSFREDAMSCSTMRVLVHLTKILVEKHIFFSVFELLHLKLFFNKEKHNNFMKIASYLVGNELEFFHMHF